MLGPLILEMGTEEQKQRHLPPIVRGEIRWCQGYSEPGAGSDLAALQTRAEDCGDYYSINGSKIWTSNAYMSDWMFCLVRTDMAAKKHEGISFVLLDMADPGLTVNQIELINGDREFCQVFFDDVKPKKAILSVKKMKGGRLLSDYSNLNVQRLAVVTSFLVLIRFHNFLKVTHLMIKRSAVEFSISKSTGRLIG